MADIQRTIDIIFGGIDNVSPTVGNITRELSGIDSAVQGIADPFADFTKSLLAAEAGVAALGGALVAFSVNEAGQLQTSLNEIGTLFNAQPEQVEAIRQEILAYGRDSVFSFDNITESTYNMISATGDVEGSVSALGIAEQAAVVGASDLNTAVNALTTVTNSYGLELDASNEVLGAFIIAVQNGKTTLPELEASIGRVAATAAGSKVPFDDLLAAVAALTAGGINTAESMTSLNALLKALAKPTDALKAALGGVSLETDGLQAVMQQLAVATGGNFTEMTQLFGSIEATKGALVLANDATGTFAKTLDQMGDKSTVLATNFELMAKNADFAMQNLMNNIKATLIQVGQPLLDEFGSSVSALSSIFKTLGVEVADGSLKPLEDALEQFAQYASQSLDDIAKALPEALGQIDFSGLIASFEDLGVVFGDVFGQIFGEGLDLSKPEDLAKALQTAVNIAESFVNITGGIIKEFDPIFAALGEAGKRISGTSTETDAAIGKFLGAMTLLGEFGTAMGSLAIIVNETGSDVERVFDLLGGSAKTVVNVVQSAFDLVVGTVVKSAALIAHAFELITPDIIGDPWGDIAKSLDELGDAVGENFARNMSEAGDGIELIGKGLSLIEDPAIKATESFKKVAETSVDLKTELSDFGVALDPVTGGLIKIGEASGRSSVEIDRMLDSIYGSGDVIRDNEASINKGANALVAYGISAEESVRPIENSADAIDKLTEREKLAIKQTNEMEKTLAQIASNERIKSMEFKANIDIANIKAQAQIVEAAFNSIASTVESLSQGVTDLWGIAAEQNGWSGEDKFFDAAKRAEDRLNRAQDVQERLYNAQIAYMQAQTDALYQESVVKIESSGLDKDIEAFMFEILKKIQLKVAGDKSAFLLGIGGAG